MVELESIQCQALLVELFPRGVPEELTEGQLYFSDFVTDIKTGRCWKVEHLRNGELTPAEILENWEECEDEKRVELLSWHTTKSVALRLRRTLPGGAQRPMSSRWVTTWSPKKRDLKKKKKGIKQRLCLRGFLDWQAAVLAVAAATASAMAHKVFSAVAVSARRRLKSYDVSTAFLKGETFEELSKDPSPRARV